MVDDENDERARSKDVPVGGDIPPAAGSGTAPGPADGGDPTTWSPPSEGGATDQGPPATEWRGGPTWLRHAPPAPGTAAPGAVNPWGPASGPSVAGAVVGAAVPGPGSEPGAAWGGTPPVTSPPGPYAAPMPAPGIMPPPGAWGPPPLAGSFGGYSTAAPVPPTKPASAMRTGIPFMLGLSVVIMGFPALLFIGYGLIAVFVGSAFTTSSNSDFGGDIQSIRQAAVGVGFVLLIVGVVGLVTVLFTASGKRTARTISTVWLVVAIIYLAVTGLITSTYTGVGGLILIGPPLVALVGLYTPESSSLF